MMVVITLVGIFAIFSLERRSKAGMAAGGRYGGRGGLRRERREVSGGGYEARAKAGGPLSTPWPLDEKNHPDA